MLYKIQNIHQNNPINPFIALLDCIVYTRSHQLPMLIAKKSEYCPFVSPLSMVELRDKQQELGQVALLDILGDKGCLCVPAVVFLAGHKDRWQYTEPLALWVLPYLPLVRCGFQILVRPSTVFVVGISAKRTNLFVSSGFLQQQVGDYGKCRALIVILILFLVAVQTNNGTHPNLV